MINFDDCFTALMGNEGGYSNNPADPGGETMWGITAKVAQRWGYTGAMIDLPQATAKQIAKSEYWDPYKCDQMPVDIAFQVFDTVYNGGYAAKWLQESVGAAQDGIIGPNTLKQVNGQNSYAIIMRFDAYRMKYLLSLPAWPTFGRGWIDRIANNLLKGAGNVTIVE